MEAEQNQFRYFITQNESQQLHNTEAIKETHLKKSRVSLLDSGIPRRNSSNIYGRTPTKLSGSHRDTIRHKSKEILVSVAWRFIKYEKSFLINPI